MAKNNFADYDELNTLLVNAEKTHPLLQNYQYKLNLLEIDRQVKRQDLLPKLNLKYNQLGKGYDVPNTLTYQALNLQNNFQYGVKLEMPLFFSQGRGGYRQAKLKIESTQIDQQGQRAVVAGWSVEGMGANMGVSQGVVL